MKHRGRIDFLLRTALFWAAFALAAVAQPELAVSDVVPEQRSLDRGANDATDAGIHWRYRLSRGATVRVSIYDSRDILVRRLVENAAQDAGDHRARWDGRDDLGRNVPPGYYLLTIQAEAGGERVLYDPSDTTGGTLIDADGARFDADARRIRYSLPEAALIRIHAGLASGLLLRTPVDWVARTAGRHEEYWDGMDESGVVDFGRSRELDVQIWAYRLPVNAIVVRDAAARQEPEQIAALDRRARHPLVSPSVRSEFLEFDEPRERRERQERAALQMYDHWRQDRATARNPKIYLTAPEGWPKNGDAIVVDRPVGIRLNAAAEDEAFLQGERFETVIYLDGSFVFEEEQGYLPFTWQVRPELIPPGEHVVTIMVRGYDGHFGSGSLKVYRPAEPIALGPGTRESKGNGVKR